MPLIFDQAPNHEALRRAGRGLAACYDRVPQAGELRGVAAQPPEPPGHPEQAHRLLESAVVDHPGHRGPQIVVLGRPPAFDAGRYKERNTVERCFAKLRQFRAVATRYDKRD